MTLIPATIITGFLGSGKTTLLKRLLTEAHGQKIAVIENEFGEEPIDNDILVSDTAEQIIQMNNGCVCCTIREDLRSTLTDLAERRRSGTLHFGRVVIETTGLADPDQWRKPSSWTTQWLNSTCWTLSSPWSTPGMHTSSSTPGWRRSAKSVSPTKFSSARPTWHLPRNSPACNGGWRA